MHFWAWSPYQKDDEFVEKCGKYDPAVYRNGVWWTSFSSNGSYAAVQFGIGSDIPVLKGYIP